MLESKFPRIRNRAWGQLLHFRNCGGMLFRRRRRISARRALTYIGAVGLVLGIGALSLVSAGAHGDVVDSRPVDLLTSFRRPTAVPAPENNPITALKAALGKALFFDPRLSGSGTIACATCHNPSLGWEDGRPLGVGHHGSILTRHTPTILNVAWAEPLFWDGRADTLEEQVKAPISAVAEMNMPLDKAAEAVRDIPGYRAAFAAAFPGKAIDIETIAKAIATYERTVISGIAPFDRWVDGDKNAISEPAKRGFAIFNTKAGCSSCHSGWRFSDDGFHDIGLPGNDMGRAMIMPGLTILERAFKTPTLRNIAQRPPYMHDGSLATLEAVIDHYNQGFVERPSLAPEIKRINLNDQEKADLVAFLQSLSSRDENVTAPIIPR